MKISKQWRFIQRLLLLFLISLLLAGAAAPASGGDAETAIFNPSRHPAHQISDLQADPSLRFGSLENGMRYILMPNPKPENRVRMHLFIQVGAMHEKPNERGIAHYLEHMLFNGTENFAAGELVKYFQSLGMQFGPDVNGRTGFFSTVYDLDLPEGGRKSLDNGLLVLADYAAGALIEAQEVEKERNVILAEKRTRDSVNYRTFKETLEFELPDALIPGRLPIGTEKVIKAADRELLKNFYDAWYRPERMFIVMVGDFDMETAGELIKSRFGGLSPRAGLRDCPDPGKISHSGIKTFYHQEPEAGETRVTIETVRKRPQPADSRELRRERLLSGMAGQIINYRLDEMLNEPDTPFTSARTSAGNYLHYVQASEIHADCAPEEWAAALRTIEQTLRKALVHGFTENELLRVKEDRLADLKQRVKSADTRESGHLARRLISSLDRRRVFQSPEQELDLLAPMIAAADRKSLHEALKKDWAPEHRLVLVTGNADLNGKAESAEKQILDTFQDSRETRVKPPVETAKPDFPYLDPPAGNSRITSEETIENLGIVRIEFANNITLNIKKTDFKANQVVAALAFGGGRAVEPAENPGLSGLARKVCNLSGLGNLNREELRRVLAGKNTQVEFQVEENQFVFKGQSVSDEIALLFQLLYAHLNDPGFRREAYELAMRQFAQKYESWRHSIHGALQLEGMRFLAGGDSRFGMPDYATFKKNSLMDVKKWIRPAITRAPLEISVVGDVDMETVVQNAKKYFGTMEPRIKQAGRLDQERRPFFPTARSRRIAVPTKINKGLVDVAFPTDDYWDIHRNRRLSVLSNVMADRMRIKIREDMGAAYSYHTYNQASRAYPGYGVYHAMVEIAPPDADKVIGAVKEIAADLARNGVSAEERDRAVKPVLTAIRERRKTNTYWLNNVLKGSRRHPEQIAWSRTFLSGYEAITAEELSRAASRYLATKEAASLIIVPEKAADDSEEDQAEPGGS